MICGQNGRLVRAAKGLHLLSVFINVLEIDFTDLSRFHFITHKYWTLAVNTARTAQELDLVRGARAK